MNKILLIEDDETICSILADILQKYGNIQKAHSFKDAQRLLDKHTFDLIIADYYLGDSNGLEVVKSIQASIGHIPIILISAFPTVDMLQEGIELKIYTFLRKPIDFDLLIEKVESLLLFDVHYSFNSLKITLMNSSFGMVINEEEIQLTEIQFKMMKYFLDHADKIVERDKMTSFIWGSKKLSSENTLDTHLLNLKKKVPLLRDYLKTLPRVGYMLSSERKVV
jgi:DNA-binding response OmpR family regulator